MRDQTEPWIAKAREDFKASQVLFDAGLTDPACFHAQQSAEKWLKALLEERDQPIPKTLDLDALIDRLPNDVISTAAVLTAASVLTSFAVDTRYPGTETDTEDAREALMHAQVIMDWAMSMLREMTGAFGAKNHAEGNAPAQDGERKK